MPRMPSISRDKASLLLGAQRFVRIGLENVVKLGKQLVELAFVGACQHRRVVTRESAADVAMATAQQG